MRVRTDRLVLILAVIVVLTVLVYYVKQKLFPETLLSVADRVLAAIENGDSSLIIKYMLDEEKENLNVNSETLQMFFSSFFRHKMHGFHRVGKYQVLPFPDEMALDIIQTYQHDDGRTCELIVSTIETKEGIKCMGMMKALFFSGLISSWPADKPFPSGLEKTKYWVDSTEELLPVLKETGVKGISYGKGSSLEYLTWEGFRDKMKNEYEKRIKKTL